MSNTTPAAQTAQTHHGLDKVKRYGWVMKDAPGVLMMLRKHDLRIDPAYQRDVVESKALAIAAAWSWIACGVIIVGKRGSVYWVIDGQHRVFGALRRGDIEFLPCLVFETTDVKQEAQGFLDVNAGRKPITSTGRHKAMVAAGDEIAAFVQSRVDALGLRIRGTSGRGGYLKSVGWCMKRASEDRARFDRVFTLVAEMAIKDDMFVPERVLEGVWILDARCGAGLADKRLAQRLRDKGARSLLAAANRAAAFYVTGGGKVWAEGMLTELNKGLREKFTLDT